MYKQDYLLYLKSLCLFQDINHNHLKKIYDASKIYKRETNEKIHIHNEHNMIIILSGNLIVHMKEPSGLQYRIGLLKPSDVCLPGVYLLYHVKNSIVLEVIQPSTYIEVPYLFIRDLSIKEPILYRNILRSLHKNLKGSYEEIINLMS